ncbi:MAG TPA: ComF family protein [bacterium]|nr:ComF family protein [bacterium]
MIKIARNSELANKFAGLARGLQNLIFPPVCIVCDNKFTSKKIPVCDNCLRGLAPIPETIRSKKDVPQSLDDLKITFLFNKHYRALVHYLKYKEYQSLGHLIGRKIAHKLTLSDLVNSVVVPIPLHPIKYRTRGYNQARLISKGLADQAGLKINRHILKRVKNTQSQTTLTKQERRENMKNAFQVTDEQHDIKKVILVDDVFTTGSTMDSAARTLKKAGVKTVIGVASAAPAS